MRLKVVDEKICGPTVTNCCYHRRINAHGENIVVLFSSHFSPQNVNNTWNGRIINRHELPIYFRISAMYFLVTKFDSNVYCADCERKILILQVSFISRALTVPSCCPSKIVSSSRNVFKVIIANIVINAYYAERNLFVSTKDLMKYKYEFTNKNYQSSVRVIKTFGFQLFKIK